MKPKPFIKVTNKTAVVLTAKQKVLLNRRGNELLNAGKIKEAQQIFRTTGYSDGLTRAGDYYLIQNQYLEALECYRLAKNKQKLEHMMASLVYVTKMIIGNL